MRNGAGEANRRQKAMGWCGRWALVALAALCFATAGAARASGERHALIIAIDEYGPGVGSLSNPRKDAAVMRRALEAHGYRVTIAENKDRIGILRAVQDHARALRRSGPGATGFFYYSGHGAQKPGTNRNYILPKGVGDPGSDDLWFGAVALTEVRDLLQEGAPDAAHIVVFDACRNELRGSKGFSRVENWGGMLLAYSTEPGATASDGASSDRSGPYAAALAESLDQSRGRARPVSAAELFGGLRSKVAARAAGQRPWFDYGLDRPVFFGGDGAGAPTPSPSPAPSEGADSIAWNAVQSLPAGASRCAALRVFLKEHPSSRYASAARVLLASCPAAGGGGAAPGRAYTFEGVKTNLPISRLTGWSLCFSESYGDVEGSTMSDMLSACRKDKLLLGCRRKGGDSLVVAAHGDRNVIVRDTGEGSTDSQIHNGSQWYLDDSGGGAWGFAPAGAKLNLSTCDNVPETFVEQRLCWHLKSERLWAGWLCGKDTVFGGDHKYERVIFQAD